MSPADFVDVEELVVPPRDDTMSSLVIRRFREETSRSSRIDGRILFIKPIHEMPAGNLVLFTVFVEDGVDHASQLALFLW